ncbi:MAG TPA: hypothetical protein VIL81_02750 [Candidatus Limnocylindrales bacterium]
MSLEPIIVIAAAIAAVGLVVLAITVRDRPAGPTPKPTAAQPGALDGARDVIDQSIGMYALRRLTGRRTSTSADVLPPERGPAAASRPSANEVPIARTASIPAAGDATADRPGLARTSRAAVSFYETEPSRPAPVATAVRPPVATAVRPPVTSVPPRERLVRDTGIALVGLTVLGLAVVTLWPHGSNGPPVQGLPGVVRASGPVTSTTLAGATSTSAPGASPSGVVLSETGRPTRAPTVSPVVTPSATHRRAGTPRPTTNPTATPPGSTPSPIPTPSPGLTPSPEPSATPITTPEPTPLPTPEPTPTPTPDPTPTPTAS